MPKSNRIFARFYPWIARASERGGGRRHRARLLAGLEGRVIEVGAGNGLNFAHYPEGVLEVIAIEPEPHLRELAREAAARARTRVRVIEGFAEDLPAADGEFDAAVASLMLCSVADQAVVLREIRRAVRPAGELRFYEHVVSENPRSARVQRLADATFWPRIAGGCHCSRDTLAAIGLAGFEVERHEAAEFKLGAGLAPALPHVLGLARRI
jgi:SAM-dependent methyltransferase